jgi:hypothetical protein
MYGAMLEARVASRSHTQSDNRNTFSLFRLIQGFEKMVENVSGYLKRRICMDAYLKPGWILEDGTDVIVVDNSTAPVESDFIKIVDWQAAGYALYVTRRGLGRACSILFWIEQSASHHAFHLLLCQSGFIGMDP